MMKKTMWDTLSYEHKKLYIRLLREDGHSDEAIGAYFGVGKGPAVGFRHRHLPDLETPKATKPRVEEGRLEWLIEQAKAQKPIGAPSKAHAMPEVSQKPQPPAPIVRQADPATSVKAARPVATAPRLPTVDYFNLPRLAGHGSVQCTGVNPDGRQCGYTADSCPKHR